MYNEYNMYMYVYTSSIDSHGIYIIHLTLSYNIMWILYIMIGTHDTYMCVYMSQWDFLEVCLYMPNVWLILPNDVGGLWWVGVHWGTVIFLLKQ